MPTDKLIHAARSANLAHVRRAEAIVQEIEQHKGAATAAFYRIGSLLLEMQQKRLWVALGYRTLGHLLEDRALMSLSMAKRLQEITKKCTASSAQLLGPELAYAMARYVARTKAKDTVDEIVRRGFPVGGRRKPVTEVTVREVLDSTLRAVVRQKGRHGESARAKRDAEVTAKAVVRRLGARGLDGPDVRLEWRSGQWMVVVRVPAAKADAVLSW